MQTDPRRWVQALRASHEALVDVVSGLSPEQLSAQSYCSDWSVAQVFSHIGSGAQIMLVNLERTLAGGPQLPREDFPAIWEHWNGLGPAAKAAEAVVWDRRHVSVMEGLDDAALAGLRLTLMGMEFDAVGVVGLRLGEHAVHLWDAEVTFDPGAEVRASSVELLVDRASWLAGLLGKADRRAQDVAELHVEVKTSAPERRFLLSAGDAVSLSDYQGQPTDGVLVITAAGLLRLISGRLDPGHTPAGARTEGGADLDELRRVFPGF